jgi:CRISPR/Cas system CSM-associated protein Csm3 (group 7 of RAMP superfamily)
MLAKYAEFSNIGGNKTGGYGVVKMYSNKDRREKVE